MRLRMQAFAKFSLFCFLSLAILEVLPSSAPAQSGNHAWTNPRLSPDERASMVVKEMTIDEKISLLHGTGMVGLGWHTSRWLRG